MALAFDSTSTGVANPTTSLSYAHTTIATGCVMVFFVQTDTASDTATNVTYAGVGATKLNSIKFQANNDGRFHATWILTNAATGLNNVVVTVPTNTLCSCISLAYSGADTTNALDGNATNSGTGTSLSVPVTTTSANDFIVGLLENGNAGGVTLTGGATLRYTDAIISNGVFGDVSAPTAGANTITATGGTSVAWTGMAVAIKPPGAAPGVATYIPTLLTQKVG